MDLYKAHIRSVVGLDEAVASSMRALSTLAGKEFYSEQATTTFPRTPPVGSRRVIDELALAVCLKINDDAMYHEEYTSTVVTAKRVVKRLSQAVLKSVIVEAKFIETDYLHDVLCAAVQVTLYSPLDKLRLVKPGSEKLLSNLEWKKSGDWFMDHKLAL
jgi:hypothetical protein